MVWYGMVWYGMVWYGMVWYGMVWCGVVWYGMVWYGMVWYGNNNKQTTTTALLSRLKFTQIYVPTISKGYSELRWVCGYLKCTDSIIKEVEHHW